MNQEFPIYRKLSNNKVFYKINSDIEFEEIQLIGSKIKYFRHKAQQYPEKLKIMDLISQNEQMYLSSFSEEWQVMAKRL